MFTFTVGQDDKVEVEVPTQSLRVKNDFKQVNSGVLERLQKVLMEIEVLLKTAACTETFCRRWQYNKN